MHPHDAVEHECKKAGQRVRTDALRQPEMNGCKFDVGLQLEAYVYPVRFQNDIFLPWVL